MKDMRAGTRRLFSKSWMCMAGLLLVSMIYAAALSGGLLTPIHDQLDGEIMTYILKARHPFGESIPQLFNGTPAFSMTPPALLFTILYMLFTPPTAFFINYLAVALSAYLGMYLCVKRLLGRGWIAAATAVLFSLLPFYSVYGLSVMGQPLLVYSFYALWEEGRRKPEGAHAAGRLLPYLLIALFACSSSLVLVGFADLTAAAVIGIYGMLRGRRMRAYLAGFLLLCGIYAVTNTSLISGVLGLGGFASHKSEYVASAGSATAFETAKQMFLDGQYHAASRHRRIIAAAGAVFLLAVVFRKRFGAEDRTRMTQMGLLYLAALLIAGFYALWHCGQVTALRNRMGGLLVEFQADRFYWLYPVIWFLLLAYTLYFLCGLLKSAKWVKGIPVVLLLAANLSFLWANSSLKVNWEAGRTGAAPSNYAAVDTFFQEEMFRGIDELIRGRSGKQKEEYRVISVGLHPSIALYNGFYCLDGYSNNYDVRYKHEFREVIGEEIDKNPRLRSYYDAWGNRVYAFSSEIPFIYYPSKSGSKRIKNLQFNFTKLREMGCEYVFSAVPIENCEDLELIGSFETDSSHYKVYTYELLT